MSGGEHGPGRNEQGMFSPVHESDMRWDPSPFLLAGKGRPRQQGAGVSSPQPPKFRAPLPGWIP